MEQNEFNEIDEIAETRKRIIEKTLNNNTNSIKTQLSKKSFGKLTKTAGIIAMVYFCSYLVIHTISVISGWINGIAFQAGEKIMALILGSILSGAIGEVGVGILAYVFAFAYVVTLIVFSANLIADAGKSLISFKKSKNPLITYACFYFLWSLVGIDLILNSKMGVGVLTLVVVVFTIFAIIIDLIKASKENLISEQTATEKQTHNSQPKNIDQIQNDLTKLNNMLNQNLITKDEYEKLKSNLLK